MSLVISFSDLLKSFFDKQIAALRSQLDHEVEVMEVKAPLRRLYDSKDKTKDTTKDRKDRKDRKGKKNKTHGSHQFNEDLDVILLSGGLGGSPYVVKAIEAFVAENGGDNDSGRAFHPKLTRARVVVSSDPQFCVALGLLDILFEPHGSRMSRKKSAFGFLKRQKAAMSGMVPGIPISTPRNTKKKVQPSVPTLV